MHKDKIKYTNATIAILLQSFAYLTTMVTLGLAGYLVNYDYINELGFVEYFFFIGLMANGLIIVITLFAMFSKGAAQKVVNLIYKVFKAINDKKLNFSKLWMEVEYFLM